MPTRTTVPESKMKKPIVITRALLKKWPLPEPGSNGDKDEKGSALVIAGTEGMPGAAILSAMAVLRSGAGKLQVATVHPIAEGVAFAIPEAKVITLPNKGVKGLKKPIEGADAIVLGPGMQNVPHLTQLLKKILSTIQKQPLIIDAEAIKCLKPGQQILPLKKSQRSQIIMTPHAGELADLLDVSRTAIEKNPLGYAQDYALKTGIITLIKGQESYICAPDGTTYLNPRGHVGLGTSGSGDTLTGIIAAFAARGATPIQATVWAVFIHAHAGLRLAKRIGKLGYLAREIIDEIPAIMDDLR